MDRGHAWVTHCDDAVVTAHARGDIDMIIGRLPREVLLEAVERAGPHGVAVDLLAVRFIDSVGLAALVTGFKAADSAGLPFTVAAASPSTARLLRMTGLARLWGFTVNDPPAAPNEPLTGLAPHRHRPQYSAPPRSRSGDTPVDITGIVPTARTAVTASHRTGQPRCRAATAVGRVPETF